MTDFVIRANRTIEVRQIKAYKGGTGTHTIDFSPWADDFGTVTAVVGSVESGQASIGNESLASNVKTFTLTTSEVGSSMLKFTATAGNNVEPVYIRVFTKDPRNVIEDYGIIFR